MPRYGYGSGVPVYQAVNEVGRNLRDIVNQNLAQKLELGKVELAGKKLALQGQLAETALKEQKAKGELAMAQLEDQRRQREMKNRLALEKSQAEQDYRTRSLGLKERGLDIREQQAESQAERAGAYADTQRVRQRVLSEKLDQQKRLNKVAPLREHIQSSAFIPPGVKKLLLQGDPDWLNTPVTLADANGIFGQTMKENPGWGYQMAYETGVDKLEQLIPQIAKAKEAGDTEALARMVQQFDQVEKGVKAAHAMLGRGKKVTSKDKDRWWEMAQWMEGDPLENYKKIEAEGMQARKNYYDGDWKKVLETAKQKTRKVAPQKGKPARPSGTATPAKKQKVTDLINWHVKNNPEFGKGTIQAMLQQGKWDLALRTLERMKRITEQRAKKEK